MDDARSSTRMISRLFFRLLPIQILLAMANMVNGIVSSLFAANSVGAQAMSAIGLYAPVNTLMGAVNLMIVIGAQLLCGKFMGKHQVDHTQRIFSLDLVLTVLFALLMTALHAIAVLFGLTSVFTDDPVIRGYLDQYIWGQAIGILPLLLSQQLAAFLSLENKTKRTTAASVVFIAVNVLMNFLFVATWKMEAFGLALASSLGLWVFFAMEAQYYFSGKSLLKFSMKDLRWREAGEIFKIGCPGALGNGYQALRGVLVNGMILSGVGAVGISAFTAANTLMNLFWTIPTGMIVVSRMLISVSVGEEDRQTLTDVMKTALFRCVPLMCAVSALIILCAEPLTRLYYRDPAEPVYQMTVWGFRLLPICMPLSIICMHFVCYGQISGKSFLVQLLSVLDGVVCVAGFTALLMPRLGMNSVYAANILNGVVTALVIAAYAWIRNRRAPKSVADLMVIPEDFGVPKDARMDLSVQKMEEVVSVSRQVEAFCQQRGIDPRRSFLAGLCLEEMAGNVVAHGFTKDRKKHTADIRVAHKGSELILRIKDDCIPFDPGERRALADPEDKASNIGLRMVYSIARKVDYQNILGMNVLTIFL